MPELTTLSTLVHRTIVCSEPASTDIISKDLISCDIDTNPIGVDVT